MGLYMDAPQAPAVPNPTTTAAAQTQGDVTSAVANTIMGNANQTTPYGSINYQQTGNTVLHDAAGNPLNVPSYSSTTTLSPAEQQLFDQQTKLGSSLNNLAQGQVDNLSNVLSKPVDTSNVAPLTQSVGSGPQLQTQIGNAGPITTNANQGQVSLNSNALQNLKLNTDAPTSFENSGPIQNTVGDNNSSRAVQNTVNAIMSRTQPQLDRNTAALQAQLANQGVTPGSQAWNTAIDANNRGMNDAYMQADLTGNQEQNTLFNQAVQQGNFTNAAQNQDFSQKLARGNFSQAGIGQNNQALLGQGNFNNAGIGQNNQALLSQGNFNNNANLTNAQFGNQAQDQLYQQMANNAGFSNNANQGMFANKLAGAQFGNQAAGQQLQQDMSLYQMPINDISALMSGGQATVPQFAAYNGGQVAGSTAAANTYNSANLSNQQYAQQMGFAGQNNAGLYGLGAAALGAAGKVGAGLFMG